MKRFLPVVLILLFVVLSVGSSRQESLTFDEIVHAEEGIAALTHHTFLVDTNNPPLIRELLMLPKVLGAGVDPRSVTIFLGVVLLIAVYRTTKKYFGQTQATVALFLLVLEPTFLANSHYVTLDTGFTLFFFLAYVALLRLKEKYSTKNLLLAGSTFGLAASSKMLALPFLLVSAILIRPQWGSVRRVALFVLITGVVIWATYFFRFDVLIVSRVDSGRLSSRLHAYAKSHNKIYLEKSLNILETTKIPLGNYLAAIKNTIVRSGQPQEIFFLGSFYDHSRWYFLPVHLLYKISLPLLVLFVLGLVAHPSLFAVPVFVIIAVVSSSNIQPFVRYVLPAIPFMAIVAASSVKLLFTPTQKTLFVVLCLWYGLIITNAFPHFISYANELAGPRALRYTKFMDSNLDWGQSLPDMKEFVQAYTPAQLHFSYFGRDNGDAYGLSSNFPYGDFRYEQICAFHDIPLPYGGTKLTAISISNWYYCGYYKDVKYNSKNVQKVVGDSILIFYE